MAITKTFLDSYTAFGGVNYSIKPFAVDNDVNPLSYITVPTYTRVYHLKPNQQFEFTTLNNTFAENQPIYVEQNPNYALYSSYGERQNMRGVSLSINKDLQEIISAYARTLPESVRNQYLTNSVYVRHSVVDNDRPHVVLPDISNLTKRVFEDGSGSIDWMNRHVRFTFKVFPRKLVLNLKDKTTQEPKQVEFGICPSFLRARNATAIDITPVADELIDTEETPGAPNPFKDYPFVKNSIHQFVSIHGVDHQTFMQRNRFRLLQEHTSSYVRYTGSDVEIGPITVSEVDARDIIIVLLGYALEQYSKEDVLSLCEYRIASADPWNPATQWSTLKEWLDKEIEPLTVEDAKALFRPNGSLYDYIQEAVRDQIDYYRGRSGDTFRGQYYIPLEPDMVSMHVDDRVFIDRLHECGIPTAELKSWKKPTMEPQTESKVVDITNIQLDDNCYRYEEYRDIMYDIDTNRVTYTRGSIRLKAIAYSAQDLMTSPMLTSNIPEYWKLVDEGKSHSTGWRGPDFHDVDTFREWVNNGYLYGTDDKVFKDSYTDFTFKKYTDYNDADFPVKTILPASPYFKLRDNDRYPKMDFSHGLGPIIEVTFKAIAYTEEFRNKLGLNELTGSQRITDDSIIRVHVPCPVMDVGAAYLPQRNRFMLSNFNTVARYVVSKNIGSGEWLSGGEVSRSIFPHYATRLPLTHSPVNIDDLLFNAAAWSRDYRYYNEFTRYIANVEDDFLTPFFRDVVVANLDTTELGNWRDPSTVRRVANGEAFVRINIEDAVNGTKRALEDRYHVTQDQLLYFIEPFHRDTTDVEYDGQVPLVVSVRKDYPFLAGSILLELGRNWHQMSGFKDDFMKRLASKHAEPEKYAKRAEWDVYPIELPVDLIPENTSPW